MEKVRDGLHLVVSFVEISRMKYDHDVWLHKKEIGESIAIQQGTLYGIPGAIIKCLERFPDINVQIYCSFHFVQ